MTEVSMQEATALSPLDGRYAQKVAPLRSCFGEFALVRERCRVEIEHAFALDATGLFGVLTPDERRRADETLAQFGAAEFARVKAIEAETRHDVKAVEYFLRERLALAQPNRIHFGLTSEDVNNLAHTACLARYRDGHLVPTLSRIVRLLATGAVAHADTVFPAHTHGQPASPTTYGKELAVVALRLQRLRDATLALRFRGKLNGATGNASAFLAAAPQVDWRAYERGVVERLGFDVNPATTQIEDGDAWARLFDTMRGTCNVVVDLCRDQWSYISMGLLVQRTKAGEVGSSTMPHKVNPIRFENAEGNAELAVALLGFLSDKLTRSRLQRDLTGSTVSRNMGVAAGHMHLALTELEAGLSGVDVDVAECLARVERVPELLAEPIQSILRLSSVGDPYDDVKRLVRGRKVTAEQIAAFADTLEASDDVKRQIRALRAASYVGDAARVAREVGSTILAQVPS